MPDAFDSNEVATVVPVLLVGPDDLPLEFVVLFDVDTDKMAGALTGNSLSALSIERTEGRDFLMRWITVTGPPRWPLRNGRDIFLNRRCRSGDFSLAEGDSHPEPATE